MRRYSPPSTVDLPHRCARIHSWARQRFCANFGFRGVYNFDSLGHEQQVTGDQAQAQDRRRALQITAISAAIGLGVAMVAMSV
jgi:hypothetical protein